MDEQKKLEISKPDGQNSKNLRSNNLSVVAWIISEIPGISRAEIAKKTGLTKATVSELVSYLSKHNVIYQSELSRIGALGRPANSLDFDSKVLAGAIEINVDYAGILVTDLAGRAVFTEILDLPARIAPNEVPKLISKLLNKASEKCNWHKISLTLGVPGVVDKNSNLINAPHLGWTRVNVADLLDNELKGIEIHNEANLAALSELTVSTTKTYFYLSSDIGVGGALVVNSQLMSGDQGYAGEIGHIKVAGNSKKCRCTKSGCLETIAGKRAISEGLRRKKSGVLKSDHPKVIIDSNQNLGKSLDEIAKNRMSEYLSHLELNPNKAQTKLYFKKLGNFLGEVVSYVINLIDVNHIIFGGVLGALLPYYEQHITEMISTNVYSYGERKIKFNAALNNSFPALKGAAYLSKERLLRDIYSIIPST